jgi:3-deoxy-manno-octulosonate cytidylyltransferase (CMP-KDO synthetase)
LKIIKDLKIQDHKKMKIIAVIPARLGSEEIHAKVLMDLGGKPILQHVFEKVQAANCFDEILIACDHEKIFNIAKHFGASVILTHGNHICGSDRIAEATQNSDADIIVNVQADEPFLNPKMLPEVIQPLLEENDIDISTLCCEFRSKEAMEFPFNVKVVKSSYTHLALYFSRSFIPYLRNQNIGAVYQHIGVYAFRAAALRKFASLPPTPLELTEGLEQLRGLEHEFKIWVVESKQTYYRIAINTAQDLEQARKLVQKEKYINLK